MLLGQTKFLSKSNSRVRLVVPPLLRCCDACWLDGGEGDESDRKKSSPLLDQAPPKLLDPEEEWNGCEAAAAEAVAVAAAP